jgi:hypothetical protein
LGLLENIFGAGKEGLARKCIGDGKNQSRNLVDQSLKNGWFSIQSIF